MFTASAGHFVWGVAFSLLLLTGCVTDLRTRKIPNELVLAILVAGWVFALTSADPLRAIAQSLTGTAVGFAIWIGFYVVGAIGAGDVKFFAAAGGWLGPALTWRAALVAAVFGGAMALLMLLKQKRLRAVTQRLGLAVSARAMNLVSDGTDSSKQHPQLPYGVALAVGTLVAAWFPGFVQR